MKIKKKFDLLIATIIIIFLIILSVTIISNKYVHKKTLELVNVSKELDYLTILKSTLTHLESSLEGFISNPDETTRRNVEDALDRLYKTIGRTEEFKLDNEEMEMINHLRENMPSFSSYIHKILLTDDKVEKINVFSILKEELFTKISNGIDRHWEEDLRKTRQFQKESEMGLAISSSITVGVFFILLISIFIIRNMVKRKAIDPIHEISRLSCEIAEGKLDKEIKITSGDELENLANNFNLMASKLREKLKNLEEIVNKEQRMIRELAILNDFVGYASSEIDFEVVLKRFIETARDLIRVEIGSVYIIEPGSTMLFLSTDQRLTDEKVRFLLSNRLEGLLETRTPYINNNLSIDLEDKHIRNILALPARSATELECLLVLLNKDGDFTIDDEDSLFNFAFQSFYIISLQNKLAMLATTDGLTGLYNHRSFQIRLSEELLRAERYNKSIILLLLDIDHFKKFNDTYGHQTGDDVLKTIAKIIKGSIRKVDFPARYGGEEFAIILPESDCSKALIVAERIRSAVMEYPFYIKDGSRVQITVSIGISCFPKDSTEKEDLIKKADIALYRAKEAGRNRASLFRE